MNQILDFEDDKLKKSSIKNNNFEDKSNININANNDINGTNNGFNPNNNIGNKEAGVSKNSDRKSVV